MSRLADRIVLALYAALTVAPVVALLASAPDLPLRGVRPPLDRPDLSWAGLRSERLQHQLTSWFERLRGLRGYAIFADNSALVHGFGETRLDSQVRLGDRGVLFDRHDLTYFSAGRLEVPDGGMAAFAGRIAELQRRLLARGVALVPVIVPAKTSIYGDAVPVDLRIGAGPTPMDDLLYRAMTRRFDELGARYVDGHALLTASTEPRDLLWSAEGRHWSLYSACLVLRQALAARAALVAGPVAPYPCHATRQTVALHHSDFDLMLLLNAWGTRPLIGERPVVSGRSPPSASPSPSLLLVGTSFTGMLADDAVRSQSFAGVDVLFYARTHVLRPSGEKRPLQPRSPEWRALVLGRSLIVLDLFETFVGTPTSYAWEFVAQLEAELGPP